MIDETHKSIKFDFSQSHFQKQSIQCSVALKAYTWLYFYVLYVIF